VCSCCCLLPTRVAADTAARPFVPSVAPAGCCPLTTTPTLAFCY
jgi:hypothetical protein